jgi:signal transduction histidine kinase
VSLRWRLLGAFGYVLLFAILALEVPLTLNFSRRVDSEVRAEASSGAQAVAAAASGRLTNPRSLAALAREQGRRLGGRVIVVDRLGRVLVDSDGAAARGTPYASRPEIARALRGITAQGTRHSDSLNADLLYTAVPVVDAGRANGAVRLTQSVKAVRDEVRRDVVALLALGAAVLLLGLGLAWAIAGSLSRPLRSLARTARQIAGGDLQARATPTGSTEQVEVAQAFNDMTERLVRALDAQRDFVANASHQLRTPLTGLRLRLEEARLAEDRAALEYELDAGLREVDRIAETVDELLVLSRTGERDTPGEVLDPAEIAETAGMRWRPTAASHDLQLRVDANGSTQPVWIARADLERALDALIENAIIYGAGGKAVTIRVHDSTIDVLDEGIGLAYGEEDEIFERFARGTAGRGGPSGTGLGLAIARELMHCWKGEAELANRAEGGARATLRLPPFTGALPPV